MFTPGRQNNTISDAAGNPVPNPMRGQIVQVPDSRNGWHTISLREALNGPGQLLGPVAVDTQGYSDVWSNDITDVASQARRLEDETEDAACEATKIARGWTNGLPPDASDVDRSDFAIGTRREQAREARSYAGSLIKNGAGTLFLTSDNNWHGRSTARGGKLSVVGSHASAIDVTGATLSGSGTVTGDIDVASGVLQPGLAPEEAARITGVHLTPGNVLTAGGDVRIARAGRLAVTVRGDSDYTSVWAAGDLVLAGELDLDVQGSLTPGTELTLMTGNSVSGMLHQLPEGRVLLTGGHLFRVSYRNNSVTLTVIGTIPPRR